MSADRPQTDHELENRLKGALRDLPGATPDIDLPGVLRRSARRRLPVQIALGTGALLAVAGIGGVVAMGGFGGLGSSSMSTTDSATESSAESAPDPASGPTEGVVDTPMSGGSTISRAPAEKLNLCGGTVAEIAASESGLVLTTSFPDAAATTGPVAGVVTLVNGGSTRVVGTTAVSPAITLSKDGLVLWHSNGPTTMMAIEVDLDPGETMEYPASFEPVTCGVEDDSAEAFRPDLPAVPKGDYAVSAAMDLTTTEGVPVLVTGPTEQVTLG